VSEEKTHTSFTAADIEKYHKGQLPANEMHALEKAALDDPFLADALEGYAASKVNVHADVHALKKRLEERVKGAKIIPLTKGGRKNYVWLRVAAMIIAIAGAGLLVYQFAFNKKPGEIAWVKLKKQETIKTTDSGLVVPPSANVETKTGSTQLIEDPKEKPASTNSKKVVTEYETVKMNGSGAIRSDSVVGLVDTRRKIVSPPVSTPVKAAIDNDNLTKQNGYFANKNAHAVTKEDYKLKVNAIKKEAEADSIIVQGYTTTNRSLATNNRAQNQQADNLFRGRVTDLNNNPVPFANITNTRDNAGTYTDVKGNFNFVSPDSVLDVQVRSIGYENSNTQLRYDVSNNQVVLQDDQKSLSEAIVVNKKPNMTTGSRESNTKIEEPEPADGWYNYNAYILNNLAVPDEIKTKKMSGEVELSFEVDKKGDPVNIKVERSLCDKCDEEAVRLVKEGPKWKRKAKKGKGSVTVPF
jgi:TonB family protein